MKRMRVIDTHTGGEPTRVVVEGGPALRGATLAERRDCFREQFDHYRRALVNEPRGSDVMVGALLVEPDGVIFFNNVGYLGMCGHGTMGVVEALRYLGRAKTGPIGLETPVGRVTATLEADGQISVENVASYRYREGVAVEVDGYGRVQGDIAWGGNWFFLTEATAYTLEIGNVERLTAYAMAIQAALGKNGICGDREAEIDHVEIFGPPRGEANSRNFVLCPGQAYDRSPCGTGTSAKLACLAAGGKLKPGEIWKQESIVGSLFEGSYRIQEGAILPTIRGQAWVNGDTIVLLDESDPFCWGIPR